MFSTNESSLVNCSARGGWSSEERGACGYVAVRPPSGGVSLPQGNKDRSHFDHNFTTQPHLLSLPILNSPATPALEAMRYPQTVIVTGLVPNTLMTSLYVMTESRSRASGRYPSSSSDPSESSATARLEGEERPPTGTTLPPPPPLSLPTPPPPAAPPVPLTPPTVLLPGKVNSVSDGATRDRSTRYPLKGSGPKIALGK